MIFKKHANKVPRQKFAYDNEVKSILLELQKILLMPSRKKQLWCGSKLLNGSDETKAALHFHFSEKGLNIAMRDHKWIFSLAFKVYKNLVSKNNAVNCKIEQ